MLPELWTSILGVKESVLERDFEVLQPLIDQVHPRRRNRLNASEFVHNVPSKMECEVVKSDEAQTPIGGLADEEFNEFPSSHPQDWPFFT